MNYQNTDEVKQKADELSADLKVKVRPFTFRGVDDNDLVVGFVKEPPFLVKARAMDKVYNGMAFTANLEILDVCLLKEHSDSRIYNGMPENDKFKLGAAKFCGDLLLVSTDQTEKKN